MKQIFLLGVCITLALLVAWVTREKIVAHELASVPRLDKIPILQARDSSIILRDIYLTPDSELTFVVTTIAGNGLSAFAGNNIPASNASLIDPSGLAQDSAGNLYITDHDGHNIRKIDKNGIITTVTGKGVAGYAGDGGLAINATVGHPLGIDVAEDGAIYFSDSLFNVIRKITPKGIISTIAGTGVAGFSGDGGLAVAAELNAPRGLALSEDGSLYISDSGNNRIRRLWSDGIITTYAGTGIQGFSGDRGLAIEASLNHPEFITMDKFGNLYIADTDNHRARKVTRSGIISTIAGNGTLGNTNRENIAATEVSLRSPLAVVKNNNEIYIVDNSNRIQKIDSNGKISTVVGTGRVGFNGDGKPGKLTNVGAPRFLVVDSMGTIIFTDTSHRVRKFSKRIDEDSQLLRLK